MTQKQGLETKRLVIGLLVAAALVGALLGKVAPMDAGFSSLFKTGADAETVTKNKTQTKDQTTTSETKDAELSYVEQVNQEIQQDKFAGRIKVPLMLQTDKQWKETPYGTGENNTLEKNGCAILTLTMLTSYLDNREVLPQEILDWSQNNYFQEEQGTGWTIFPEFAATKGYMYEELADMSMVESQVTQGHPVIISVQPGIFTEVGHIMVITGYSEGKFWVNDPNDNAEKKHSKTAYTAEQLGADALNYWAIYKA